MIIMSIDLGKARTGIAVCDKTEFLASPYTVIFEKSPQRLMEKAVQAVKDTKAELVVVGLPKNMDGSEGESAQNARAFAKELEEITGIKTVMQDERYNNYGAQLFKHDKHKRQKAEECCRRGCGNDNFAGLS